MTAEAQLVEKVADLNFVSNDGVGVGGYNPLDRFTQVESNLWFTTAKGGVFDAGTISRYNLETREITEVASLDNITGKAPDGALLVIDGEAYFTTTRGGSGDRGTISKINLESGVVTSVFDFPPDGSMGQTPRGQLNLIDGALWTTTSGGGEDGRGTLVKHDLNGGTTTVVVHFDGPELGGQPYEGFTQVGDTWYFTTFTGGDTYGTGGLSIGAGTLGKLTFNETGEPVVSRLVSLAGGHTQFPAQNPVAVGNEWLYFTTVGPNSAPGSIVRYNIESGAHEAVLTFNAEDPNPELYGKQPGYNGLTEWQGQLYFLTRQGGTNNDGIVAKFDTASNTLTKLADLGGEGADSLGEATAGYNTGLVVHEDDGSYIYFPVNRGGANGRGAIIRLALPGPEIALSIAPDENGHLRLTWTGGSAPFTVESRSEVASGPWEVSVQETDERSFVIPAEGPARFFRVTGAL